MARVVLAPVEHVREPGADVVVRRRTDGGVLPAGETVARADARVRPEPESHRFGGPAAPVLPRRRLRAGRVLAVVGQLVGEQLVGRRLAEVGDPAADVLLEQRRLRPLVRRWPTGAGQLNVLDDQRRVLCTTTRFSVKRMPREASVIRKHHIL